MFFGGTKPIPNAEDWRETTPWEENGVRIYDPHSRTFFVASKAGEHALGAMWLSSPLLGADDSTLDKIRAALSIDVPANSFIQVGLLATPDVEEIVAAYLQGKEDADPPVLRELVTRYHQHFLAGKDTPLVATSKVLLRRFEVMITFRAPTEGVPSDGEVARFADTAARIEEAISSAGIDPQRQDEKGYLRFTRRLNHILSKNESWYDDRRPLREQIFMPGDDVDSDPVDRIDFHGQYSARAISFKFFPKKTSLAVMNYMIGDPGGLVNQIADPFWLVLTLRYPDQVTKDADVKRRFAIITHQAFGPMTHLIPILGRKKQGFDTLINSMDGNGGATIDANLTLWVFGRTPESAARQTAALQSYLTSLGFEAREDRRILSELWTIGQPMNASPEAIKGLFRFHTLTVQEAIQFLPILGEWSGSGSTGTMLFVTRRGLPALFCLYDSPTNYNCVIFAEPGAGKSFVAQEFVKNYLAKGAKVWVIDTGYSYKKLAAGAKGTFIAFAENSKVCLNPFTKVVNIDDDMDLIKAMLSKMAAPEAGLDDFRLSVLEEAIKSTWTKFGHNASVTGVSEWCLAQTDQRIRDIGRQLYPFTKYGSHGYWFEGANNLDLDNSLVVLELEELKSRPVLQRVVLLQLISRIGDEMYRAEATQTGRQKVFIIDESWAQLDDPVMGYAMQAAYRKVRKYEGAMVIIVHSINDLYASKNGTSIIQNSAWQIIMKQKTESIDSAIEQKKFNIDPYAARMLRMVHTNPGKYSEMMIRRDDEWGVVRLTSDRFTQVMFSTKGAERHDILNDIENGVDVVDSINHFIARQTPSLHSIGARS